MKRTKQFLKNGLILACSTVFLRGVGLFFNVYITGKIGAEGIGLFGLIMSVYLFATTLANSGASLATTRLVTEELTLGCDRGIRKGMVFCLCYTLCFGLLSAGLLFFFAEPLGVLGMGDERTVKSLRALSVSMPFIALSSAMGGYFTAVRRVAKSAAAQVFEIFVKILVTVFFLSFVPGGNIEYACLAVVAGGSVAEMASCLFLFCFYRGDLRRYDGTREGEKAYGIRMTKIAVPVAVSAYLRSGLVTVEHLLVPRGLKQFGASASSSLAQYGVVHGMVMPVLLFPCAALSAFGGLLVPELSEFQKIGQKKSIDFVASRALRLTLLFGIAAAGVFFAFSHELGMAIYKSGDAGLFIRFLAPLVVVMYADNVTDAMLKGLGQQVYSMGYNIIDSAVSVVMISVLLPRFGVDGYVAVIFTTEILNAFLSIHRLLSITEVRLSLFRDVFLPAGVILTSAYGVRRLWQLRFGGMPTAPLPLFAAIFLVVAVYFAFMFLCRPRKSKSLDLSGRKPAVPPSPSAKTFRFRPQYAPENSGRGKSASKSFGQERGLWR